MPAYPDKYLTLLDHEVLAYVDGVLDAYPADAVEATIEQQRQFYEAMCRRFAGTSPANVTSVDTELLALSGEPAHSGPPVPVRHYRKQGDNDDVRVVYLHGGGFVVGNLESHDSICAELCDRTGFPLTAVDYRLAPEHPHPAAFDDVMLAIQHALNDSSHVVLCGDSAGANLAAAASHQLRHSHPGKVLGQVLIYPALGGDHNQGSYLEHAEAPMLSLQEVLFYERVRIPQEYLALADQLDAGADVASLTAEQRHFVTTMGPLLDNDFSNLPDTLCLSASCDPLHDDGEQYVAAIKAINGSAEFVSETGLVHGYLRARNISKLAGASFTRVVEALRRMGGAAPV